MLADHYTGLLHSWKCPLQNGRESRRPGPDLGVSGGIAISKRLDLLGGKTEN